MAKMTLEVIVEKLEAATAKGSIYNVEITDLKHYLGSLIWRDEAVQKARRKVEELFQPRRYELKVYEACCYLSIGNSHDLLNAVNAINRATTRAGLTDHEAVVAFFETAKLHIKAAELVKGLKDKVIKGRVPSETPNLNARTLDNTGTCGCCKRNIKLTSDARIWDHGFQIQGRGYGKWSGHKVDGSCFGVGYEPIEVSPKIWQDMLVRMENRYAALPELIAQSEKWLAENPKPAGPILPNTPEAELVKRRGLTASGLQMKKFELGHLREDIPAMKEAIATWKPRPLPGQKAAK